MSFEVAVNRLANARSLAIITGAGISAESGIPTFRGKDGLWRNYRAEDLATPEAFERSPKTVWEWYEMRREICAKAKPNEAHLSIADMENHFDDFLLITQNVDGLHTRAGSKKVLEIHGNIWKARCMKCKNVFEVKDVPLKENPVKCQCGSIARPHIVWFGEKYEPGILEKAIDFLSKTDFLIVVGTSGMVTTPIYLAQTADEAGAYIVDVNIEPSLITGLADFFLQGKAGSALPHLWNKSKEIRK